ncbi:MAG: CvpA family protein, partial [Christensenellales bacterium]
MEFFGNYEGVTASKALAMYLTDAIKNLIAGLLVFIVAYVVLLIIGKIIEKIFHFPGLNIINRLLGLVLGAVKAVAIIWVVLYAVSLIGPVNDKVTELAASAPATTWLIENNPVAGIIAGTFDPNAFVESLKELPEVVEKAAS